MHPSSGSIPDNGRYYQLKKRAFFSKLVEINYFYLTTLPPEIIASKQLSILFTCPVVVPKASGLLQHN